MSVLVFVSVRGLSLVAAVGATLHHGARASHYRGLSLRSTGSRCAGSAVVAHGPSCSAVCGIFPDQGSNPCPLHWQADSQPLRHQGSPMLSFFIPPFLLLILLSNCMLLVYIHTFDLGILIFCDLAKLMY